MSPTNHTWIVGMVKEGLVRRGVNLLGPCGAFAITKRVAWQLRFENAGLLAKSDGNQCDGFAADIVAYPDGQIFDCLIDGGGANGPSWQDKGRVDPTRWRRAVDPGDPGPDVPPLDPPDPPPAVPPDDDTLLYDVVAALITVLDKQVEALYAFSESLKAIQRAR